MRKHLLTVIFFLIAGSVFASDSLSVKTARNRKILLWSGFTAAGAGVHTWLYKTWFSDYPGSNFHWINDNREWQQMDKVGHAWASYMLSVNVAASFEWAGYKRHKSALIGAGYALAFQYAIEYFDGKSLGWGASAGDLTANTAGILFGGLQRYYWGNCRIPFRFTYRNTAYAPLRPNVLGSNFPERVLKDYNGQTYWIDLNPARLNAKPKWWPAFLGVSLGYGAEGMLGGYGNQFTNDKGELMDYSYIPRYRQFFISPSLTLAGIKSKNKVVRALCWVTDHLRIPMPAMELRSTGKPVFHLLYW